MIFFLFYLSVLMNINARILSGNLVPLCGGDVWLACCSRNPRTEWSLSVISNRGKPGEREGRRAKWMKQVRNILVQEVKIEIGWNVLPVQFSSNLDVLIVFSSSFCSLPFRVQNWKVIGFPQCSLNVQALKMHVKKSGNSGNSAGVGWRFLHIWDGSFSFRSC